MTTISLTLHIRFSKRKTSKNAASFVLLKCFSINYPTSAGSNCPFFVFIYSIYVVNEHKKGQFEPAEVGKLFAKHFTKNLYNCTMQVYKYMIGAPTDLKRAIFLPSLDDCRDPSKHEIVPGARILRFPNAIILIVNRNK
jgi:hypothetical protein